ncbi:MAG: reductive dehalogenase domain-containing protein [Gammaproteobacteria bacterium]
MMRMFSHKNRPVSSGPFPLERLKRIPLEARNLPNTPLEALQIESPDSPLSIRNAMRDFVNVMDRMRLGETSPHLAPIPDSLSERSDHLKAACYYLDASMVATCSIPHQAWLESPIINETLQEAQEQEFAAGAAENAMAKSVVDEGRENWSRKHDQQVKNDHQNALVILIEYPRDPDQKEPGANWIMDCQPQRAAIRGAEIGGTMANYLRMLGYSATLHTPTASDVDLTMLSVASGLAEQNSKSDKPENPFISDRYGVVVVTTNMSFASDDAIKPNTAKQARDFKWWAGIGGTRPGYAGEPFKKRPYHLGPYPMETVKHVDEPTTFIDTPNVPRIPKRHDMFIRAAIGDLGDKAKKELDGFRMITKSPFGHAMIPGLGSMVPLQYGKEAETVHPDTEDPVKNAQAVKAALHYLGADMVGICEIPEYAWYSHDTDGSEIKPYHKYAISILIDQGYETMEGASGDDWISGAQSMRAYMRAQLLGGIVCQHIRNLGHSARGHSVMDQDVLHIPLILNSGLGELSRIGELVLNPFVGPRFKSGVITTDMPLAVDTPIDFGLQNFCGECEKCARECPCSAISFGKKIMFNAYEIWKQDVEKCARYRITNAAGSMCGRCMKTCPYNIEGVMAERPFLWSAMHLPFTHKWISKLDDWVGNGRINPVKKWWWDLDTDEQGHVVQAKKTNIRELVFRPSLSAKKQKLACYPVDLVPPSNQEGSIPLNRKEATKSYESALSVKEYKKKLSEAKL